PEIGGVVGEGHFDGVGACSVFVHEPPDTGGAVGVEDLVGVEVEQPVAAGLLQDAVPGVGEVAVPGEGNHACAAPLGDGHGGVVRPRVPHDDLVGDGADRCEAIGQAAFLVPDDHD